MCKYVLLLMIMLITIFLMVSPAISNSLVEGIYQSVSESEWELTVTLNSDNSAQILLENWEAGEYDKRSKKIVSGNWLIHNNKISLKYDNITDILIYKDNLSLADLGLKGSAPGLIQTFPINEKSIIRGVKLWRKPHKFINEK